MRTIDKVLLILLGIVIVGFALMKLVPGDIGTWSGFTAVIMLFVLAGALVVRRIQDFRAPRTPLSK